MLQRRSPHATATWKEIIVAWVKFILKIKQQLYSVINITFILPIISVNENKIISCQALCIYRSVKGA